MQKREIFKKIGGIITELNDQYQYLSQNPENLNDLELELFLANSSFLTDHIEILRKLNHIPAAAPVREAEAPQVQVLTPVERVPELPPAAGLPSLFPLAEEEADAAFEYEKKPVAELFDRQLSPEEQAIIDRRKATERAPEAGETVAVTPEVELSEAAEEPVLPVSRPLTAEPAAVQPVIDPAPAKVTIHDVIAAQVTATSVASRFHTDTVTDLKSVISLNDKLLFIKDLFNGYSLAYSEAIELLNRFDSLEAADNFLKHNYAVKNKWDSKPETVEKLYAILNRKFS
ncbi:MAG TPA: hypothetical protein VGE15_05070 [Sphingobacteriaceae bacterium]